MAVYSRSEQYMYCTIVYYIALYSTDVLYSTVDLDLKYRSVLYCFTDTMLSTLKVLRNTIVYVYIYLYTCICDYIEYILYII